MEQLIYSLEVIQQNRRMLSPKQPTQDIQLEIDDLVAQYEQVHNQNFLKRKKQLLRQLQQQTKDKKKQLLFFKKMLSQQNLQRLISQRRRQKEKQRQNLQSRWRECNDSYKKLQEQQKRLVNQHKENLFDATKLESKIVQFQNYYDKLKEKIESTKGQKENNFITEPYERYQSPYRKDKSVNLNKSLSNLKLQKFNQSQTIFFSQKYSLNKYLVLKSSQSPLKITDGFSKTQYLMNKAKIKTLNTNYPNKSPQIYESDQQKQVMKQQLFKFILNPRIKQKIFSILYRKL